jgi:hypothetical protein
MARSDRLGGLDNWRLEMMYREAASLLIRCDLSNSLEPIALNLATLATDITAELERRGNRMDEECAKNN